MFEAEFSGCKLVGSTFAQTSLRPLTVTGGDWSFVALPGADLRGVAITHTRMREADLTGANCEKATFTDVDLSGAQLHNAVLNGCDLRGSDLTAFNPTMSQIRNALITPRQAVVMAQAMGFTVQ